MSNSSFSQSKIHKKISVRQDRFTPCMQRVSLLEPMTDAAENAAQRATILLSPARSSFDRFQNARNSGEKIYSRVKSISWGHNRISPNINGQMTGRLTQYFSNSRKDEFSLRGFLRKNHVANHSITSTSSEKGRHQRQR